MAGERNSVMMPTEVHSGLSMVDDPYYISSSEVTGHSIVSELLKGPENFVKWKRSMEIALSARSKLGFVRGEFPKPIDVSLHMKWQKCNDIVMSWMISSVSKDLVGSILHASDAAMAWSTLQMQLAGSSETRIFSLEKELANLSQGEMNVAVFYQKSVDLWQEYEAMEELPKCSHGRECACFSHILAKQTKRKVIQFLMGLNDSFLPLRTHILTMIPLPNLNVIYAMALQDEAQRGFTRFSHIEASAMYAQNSNMNAGSNFSKNGKGNAQNNKYKKNLFCTYCQLNGHSRETCYKLVGYPVGHKFYKGQVPNSAGNNKGAMQRTVVNNAVAEDGNSDVCLTSNTRGGAQLTQEQVHQLLALLQQGQQVVDGQYTMAGPTVQENPRDW